MVPTIRVDDEVYEFLQRKADAFIDTPNSVLRRLFGLGSGDRATTAKPTPPTGSGPKGKLATLLKKSLLIEGDELIWERRQHGDTHRARLVPGGHIQLSDGRVYDSPSGAARALAGYEVNGLRVWRLERNGRTLEELWLMQGEDQ